MDTLSVKTNKDIYIENFSTLLKTMKLVLTLSTMYLFSKTKYFKNYNANLLFSKTCKFTAFKIFK